eukprot:g4348.t1
MTKSAVATAKSTTTILGGYLAVATFAAIVHLVPPLFYDLPHETFRAHPLVVTSRTSFESLSEAVFLRGRVHDETTIANMFPVSPIVQILHEHVVEVTHTFVFIVNIAIATCLSGLSTIASFSATADIEATKADVARISLAPRDDTPTTSYSFALWVFTAHLFSPATVLSGYALSVESVFYLFVVSSALFAARGGILLSALAWALATAAEPLDALLLMPAILLLVTRAGRPPVSRRRSLSSWILAYISATLTSTSVAIALSTSTHSVATFLLDRLYASPSSTSNMLAPNAGLRWYLFQHVFTRFQRYHVLVTNAIPWILSLPIAVRLRDYPLVALAALFATLRCCLGAYPTAGDVSFSLVLMLARPGVARRVPLFGVLTLSLAALGSMALVMWHLWSRTTAGNANYLYFQCLTGTFLLAALSGQFAAEADREGTYAYATKVISRGRSAPVKPKRA